MARRLGTDRITTVQDLVDAVLEVSLDAMADDPAKRNRCLFLAVLAPGTLATSEMLEGLWDEVRRGGVEGAKAPPPRAGAFLHERFYLLMHLCISKRRHTFVQRTDRLCVDIVLPFVDASSSMLSLSLLPRMMAANRNSWLWKWNAVMSMIFLFAFLLS